jgi:3-hydroxyacyl-CoA dehydrogenase
MPQSQKIDARTRRMQGSVTSLSKDREIGILKITSPPVNALSAGVRQAILDGIRTFEHDPDVRAVILICDGRTFCAGADIAEFGKPHVPPSLTEVEEAIENSSKPVVAAIHGTAFGGGLETALACHYRIAVPSAKVGLPEVKLGLIPGAGGTQRLPRLSGVEVALDMIATGQPVDAIAAQRRGIVDRLASEHDLLTDAVTFAREIVAQKLPLRRVRDEDGKVAEARGNDRAFEAARAACRQRARGFRAPLACIDAVEAAVRLPFEDGMRFERAAFLELMAGDQSIAQRYVFFAERAATRVPDIPEETPARVIKSVGILGAGTMGGGIAMNFLNVGLPVTIVEAKQDALERGLAIIRKNYEATAAKGRLTTADVAERMSLLTGSLRMDDLASADLIIEAVFESMELKKDVFTRLDQIAKPDAILASNTSYLDINEIAAATRRPQSVLGLHFFSPANVMRLLEVVRGAKTDKPVIRTAMSLGKAIGKVPVLVGVCHGFVGNRMLAPRQREANALIVEGAMPWDVDRVLYDFGMPMGPFAMADLAGLDIGWQKETSRSETLRDRLCEIDRRGQKTAAGYYDYDASRKASPSGLVEKMILDFAAERQIKRRSISDQEILERTLYPMINEGAKILEEGIALRASDIDIVWINGYGWPAYRGGPMHYADTIGLNVVVDALSDLEARLGSSFAPSRLLSRLAGEGKRFKDL